MGTVNLYEFDNYLRPYAYENRYSYAVCFQDKYMFNKPNAVVLSKDLNLKNGGDNLRYTDFNDLLDKKVVQVNDINSVLTIQDYVRENIKLHLVWIGVGFKKDLTISEINLCRNMDKNYYNELYNYFWKHPKVLRLCEYYIQEYKNLVQKASEISKGLGATMFDVVTGKRDGRRVHADGILNGYYVSFDVPMHLELAINSANNMIWGTGENANKWCKGVYIYFYRFWECNNNFMNRFLYGKHCKSINDAKISGVDAGGIKMYSIVPEDFTYYRYGLYIFNKFCRNGGFNYEFK